MNADRWDAVRAAVQADLASTGETPGRYAQTVGIDPGTLADFLAGRRTPKSPTQAKLESRLGWGAGTIANVVAGRAEIPDVGGGAQTPGVSLDIDLSDLSPTDREEVIAAARLTALERARAIRRSLGE